MPDESDLVTSRPILFLLTGCLIPLLAVLLGAGCLLAHHFISAPVSPYQAKFATAGDSCGEGGSAAIRLDLKTGESLECSQVPDFLSLGEPTSYGTLSADEYHQVERLSKGLAADGSLSTADQQTVRNAMAAIGREHGWTKTSTTLVERLTWRIGWWSLGAGLAVLLCVGLYGQIKEGTAR